MSLVQLSEMYNQSLERLWVLAAGENGLNGYDYGVFDFIELFAEATLGAPFNTLSNAQKKDLFSRTEADVSDHMPIWVRIPISGA